MRIVKEAEVRRKEILDAAEALFCEKGYAATSTGDILERIGIARGTLYYHFESKAAVMEAIVKRLGERLFEAARTTAETTRGKAALERLLLVLDTLKLKDGESSAIMEHLHEPSNILLHEQIQRNIVAGITPILAGIIRDGIAEGAFDTPYPDESIKLIVVYMTEVIDGDLVEISDEKRRERLKALVFNLGRIFGLDETSLAVIRAVYCGTEAANLPKTSGL